MKLLKDMSWPHLKPKENLHAIRSSPSLKASHTGCLQSGIKHGGDLMIKRLSEKNSTFEGSLRELSPRPESDSGILTPEAMSLTPDPGHHTSTVILESRPGDIIPELNFKASIPITPIEESKKPQITLSASTQDDTQNNADTLHTQLSSSPSSSLSSSPSISAKELSASLEGLQLAVTALGLRGSHNISPHSISPYSADSFNDLIQSRPDSIGSEYSPGTLQADSKWRTSKRIPRIDVSENSMDEPLSIYLPLSNTSNAALGFPTIQTVISNHPVMITPGLQQRTFDGPASIVTVTEDLSHILGDCPTISEADEAQSDMEPTSNNNGSAKTSPAPLANNEKFPLTSLGKLPILEGSSQKHDLPRMPVTPINSEVSGHPPFPIAPGVPIDSTGLAFVPATPPSNLNRRQKMRVRGQKLVRRSRRIIMRKSILTVILGRQLAGPTVIMLKNISRGGSGAIAAASSAAPALAPIPV